eukprot:202596-Prymnesium_polylepis.2
MPPSRRVLDRATVCHVTPFDMRRPDRSTVRPGGRVDYSTAVDERYPARFGPNCTSKALGSRVDDQARVKRETLRSQVARDSYRTTVGSH